MTLSTVDGAHSACATLEPGEGSGESTLPKPPGLSWAAYGACGCNLGLACASGPWRSFSPNGRGARLRDDPRMVPQGAAGSGRRLPRD